jgi:hypothetical protein
MFVSIRERHLQVETLTRGTVALATLVLTKYVLCSVTVNFPPFRTQSTATSVSLANNTATHFMAQLLLLPALVTSYTPMWLALSRPLTQEVATWLRSSTRSLDMSPFSRSFENKQYSTRSKVFIVNMNVSIQLQLSLSTQTTGGSTHQLPHMLYNLAFPYIALPRTLRRPMALLNTKIDPYSTRLALHLLHQDFHLIIGLNRLKTLFTFVIDSLMPAG